MQNSALAKIKSALNIQLLATALTVALCIWGFQVRSVQAHFGDATFRLGAATYHTAIADTEQEREQGLGGRSSLAADEAMLFKFDVADRHCFWMKDMHFAIDMIWLDSQKRVVHIQPNVTPDTYPQSFCPPTPAQYVVEVAAGQAAKDYIHVGSGAIF